MSFKYQALLGDASINAESVITSELDATVANIGDLNVSGNAIIAGITTLNEMSAVEAGIGSLAIADTLRIPTGAGVNKILTSDATGVATWKSTAILDSATLTALTIPTGAGVNKVLTSDAAGIATWQAGVSSVLVGDVSGVVSANIVDKVGTSTAANIHSAELLANAATSANTFDTIVKRDGAGGFTAGVVNVQSVVSASNLIAGGYLTVAGQGSVTGALTAGSLDVTGTSRLRGATTVDSLFTVTAERSQFQGINCNEYCSVAGQMTLTSNVPNFRISANAAAGKVLTCANVNGDASWQVPTAGTVTLAGDVTGVSNANTVATVGGSTAAQIHSAELLANAATNLNTASAIVKRDGSGNFSAGTITANLSGNATSATTATTATTATSATSATTAVSFTGSLSGDCKGTQGATFINTLNNGAIDVNSLVLLAAAQTLSNKTLNLPTISSILNTGTLTLPISTDTLVGRLTVDTLTNKTLTAPKVASILNVAGTNTLTFPTNLTDTLVAKTSVDTLTNKTITGSTNTITANKLRFGTTEVAMGASAPTSGQVMRYDGINSSWAATSALGDSTNTANTLILRDSSGNFASGQMTALMWHSGNSNNIKQFVLYDNGTFSTQTNHDFVGFGIGNSLIRYQVSTTGVDHVFYAATSSTASNELFRIKGNGAVNMGGLLTAGALTATGALNAGSITTAGALNVASITNSGVTNANGGLNVTGNISAVAIQMGGTLSVSTIVPYSSGTQVNIISNSTHNLVVNGNNFNLTAGGTLALTGNLTTAGNLTTGGIISAPSLTINSLSILPRSVTLTGGWQGGWVPYPYVATGISVQLTMINRICTVTMATWETTTSAHGIVSSTGDFTYDTQFPAWATPASIIQISGVSNSGSQPVIVLNNGVEVSSKASVMNASGGALLIFSCPAGSPWTGAIGNRRGTSFKYLTI